MRITETNIYKTVAPQLRKSDREEFARMLRLARDGKCNFVPAASSVWGCCIWSESPQGVDWWSELARRLKD